MMETHTTGDCAHVYVFVYVCTCVSTKAARWQADQGGHGSSGWISGWHSGSTCLTLFSAESTALVPLVPSNPLSLFSLIDFASFPYSPVSFMSFAYCLFLIPSLWPTRPLLSSLLLSAPALCPHCPPLCLCLF